MRNNNIQKRAIAILLIMAMLMGSFTFGVAANAIFKDVHSNDWFYEDVNFVESEGLMQGVGNGRFDPNGAATRAMMATIFWRFEDAPEPKEMSGYKDVPNGQWYSKAIAWMKEVGLTNGAGVNKYGTNDAVTREELATFFYRYAIFKGYDVEKKNSLSNYADFGKIHGWAIEGMSWANANGIVSGRTPTTMAPQGTATRAEIAAMIHRFIVNVVEAQELPTEDTTEEPTEVTELTEATEPTEVTELTEVTEPTEAPIEPTEPTDDPTEDTEPITEPTDPSSIPTEPTEMPTEPTEDPTDSTEPTEATQPTEPTAEPTEPTEVSDEPTEAPTEPVEPDADHAPIKGGDCIVLYSPANNVVTSRFDHTDGTSTNAMTCEVVAAGATLRTNTEYVDVLYMFDNGDGTCSFVNKWEYDEFYSRTIYFTADAPNTSHTESFENSSFEIIAVEDGYLLKNVADNSYCAVENGLVVAKDLVEGDPNFIFWFAIYDGDYVMTGPDSSDLICTLVKDVHVEPPAKTATMILMVDDIYGADRQYNYSYNFALHLDPGASMYGERFDEHGLLGECSGYDLDQDCVTLSQNTYNNCVPGETDEVSLKVPIGTYDIHVGCSAKPIDYQPAGLFVPDNGAYDNFEVEEGKVYVFYVSAKGFSENPSYNRDASAQEAIVLGKYPGNCAGAAVTLFVGDGEKPEIDTAQLPHCHNWERVEHEEVKIGIYKIRCACGWTRCYFDCPPEMDGDVDGEWYDVHCPQYTFEEQQAHHNSYSDVSYTIVVSPAYSSWVCADCGEERWVSPGALDECECHTWERVRFRENVGFYSTRVCYCGWEADIETGVLPSEQLRNHIQEHADDGERHGSYLSPIRAYTKEPSYDVWICTHCGKISHEQPEADECNHVDTETVWLYSQALVCDCGWKLTTETSAYYGDFRMDIIDHQHDCECNLLNCYALLKDECWTLIEPQEEGNP